MARTVKDQNIASRNARLTLKARGKPYYRAVSLGLHIGYRRNKTGPGTWVARRYLGEGAHETKTLAHADDYREANGRDVLALKEAQAAAVAWAEACQRAELGVADRVAPLTVADAAASYLAWFERHRKGLREARSAIERHVLPALGGRELAKLTAGGLRTWHEALAAGGDGRRTKFLPPLENGTDKTDRSPEAARARKARANRVLTTLKALLNHAFNEGRVPSDAAWRQVKPFKAVDAARLRYLSGDECQRLLNACDGAFRRLVRAALETGCRYGELCRLTVGDFDPAAATLRIGDSKAGRPRHVPLDRQAASFITTLCAGRAGGEPMLQRDDGRLWGPSDQTRPLAAACEAARITPSATFHALRHTWASHRIMAGMPLQVAAGILGHSDTRMVERHYGHLSKGYVREVVERTGLRLAPEPSSIHPLRRA